MMDVTRSRTNSTMLAANTDYSKIIQVQNLEMPNIDKDTFDQVIIMLN